MSLWVSLQMRVAQMRQGGSIPDVESLRKRKEDLDTQSSRVADAIASGGEIKILVDKLRSIEKERGDLDRRIEAFRPINLTITPQQIRERVVTTVMNLKNCLKDGGMPAARQALAKHIGQLVLTPKIRDGRRVFEVTGSVNLAPDSGDGVMQLVARDGIGTPIAVHSA